MATLLIDLKRIPNQEFYMQIDNKSMRVRIIDRGIILFSLLSNDKYVVQNVPCFPNQGILPYPYMINEIGGNFMFITDNDEYPYWENFDSTCSFVFVTEGCV